MTTKDTKEARVWNKVSVIVYDNWENREQFGIEKQITVREVLPDPPCENCKRLEDALYHESRKAPEVAYLKDEEIKKLQTKIDFISAEWAKDKAKLEICKKDSERLDWFLENQNVIIYQVNAEFEGGWIYKVNGSVHGFYYTKRDALDAAMQKLKGDNK